ncbi:MAG: ArsA family ATPase [Deltaproteobacteria bacterium]|nr:ArsA family ATPase [Deltaproteobacteria bacterium]MBW2068898.1 ArsA family ATPase [Deltaproteobacteria bacterium]
MRVILYAGKGGVGKTSVAAATALHSAEFGYKTLIMSLDIAHNLSDIFDVKKSLLDFGEGKPLRILQNLWIQELDMHRELQRNWKEVHGYLSMLLNTTGFNNVLAEELAILPGMEEVSALLWINRYVRHGSFDVIVLDCAPTGEAIRFISVPKALEWYVKKIFNLERNILRVARPIAKRVSDVPLPDERYFENIQELFDKLQGVDEILTDSDLTSVRLVANPERIVLKETLRAFMYFNLYEINIDAIVLNKMIPTFVGDTYFDQWKKMQAYYVDQAKRYFDPVPLFTITLSDREIIGPERLEELGKNLFGEEVDPTRVFHKGRPFEFIKKGETTVIKIAIPFVEKEDVEVYSLGDELVLKVGVLRRNIPLPRSAVSSEIRAHLRDGTLEIELGGGTNYEPEQPSEK